MQLQTIGLHDSLGVVFPPEKLREALADLDAEVRIVGDDPNKLTDCDALVTFAHREEFLDADLDWIHSIQAGYDRFPLDAFEEANVTLTNSSGIHRTSVGEFGVGLMLMLARRLHAYSRQQTRNEWRRPEWDEGFTLAGESLCVVGLGTLGYGIAERADALGMTVTGVRRSGESRPGVEEVYTPDELHEAISDATFVALAVPLTEETEGMMSDAEFAAMREDAYFLNVARGACVDQSALVAALEAGEIAGAGLDVFEEEPLPESSPLWEMDEVIVTPHAAAAERDYYRHIEELVRENVERIRTDGELTNRVI
ncbi:D-2-hydroxyacid dehydrogenase [Halorussus halophilus]|uniref:D-2-hydroxyacid dehydrogenase n=1 Tax=Halorussus halophilus TaxID=2650975 RepID=UPI0013012C20|nr:D-2-hydroxyacid dehydrogenase [Halorussus halophilus]